MKVESPKTRQQCQKRRWVTPVNFLASTLLSIGMVTSAFAAPDMSVSQVLADNCKTTPGNFSFSDYWNKKMSVLGSWCNFPVIPASIPGKRKPQAFAYGSANSQHDIWAAEILNGTGENSNDLGIYPLTQVTFGTFCTNASPLNVLAKPGDVVFSLRAWDESCAFLNPGLPTIPVIGRTNNDEFVGDTQNPNRILISTGANFGRAIDYYTTGGGRISYAIPEFAGVVVALNTALIAKGRNALNTSGIKQVLDSSSSEVYMKVNGVKGIYNESQVDALLAASSENRYYGQLINLTKAINTALGVTAPPPGDEKLGVLNSMYFVLFDEETK